MAKQIKAIKCPHCGSVEKSKLDKDLYHCDSCNTDYFLDNDDVNINVNHQTNPSNNKSGPIKPLPIVSGIIIGIVVISFLSNIFSSNTPTRTVVVTTSQRPSAPTVKPLAPPVTQPKPEPKSNTFRVAQEMNYPLLTADGSAIAMSLGYRTYDREGKTLNGYYWQAHDILSNKVIREEKIESLKQVNSGDAWDYRRFSDGQVYLTFANDKVYVLSESDLSLKNVSNEIFANYAEFNSGIASVNLAAWGYEDCFYVLTNNGKEYYFYPLLGKVYAAYSPELRDYFDLLDKQRRYAVEPYIRTSFLFVKQDVMHLFKVVYHTQNLEPRDKFGILFYSNENKPYKINLQYGEGPIVEDKELTPGRIYFSPTVVYAKDDILIIKSKNNASPSASYNLQRLDINTGDVLWTLKGDEKYNFSSLVAWEANKMYGRSLLIPYKKGFIIQLDYGKYIQIDEKGQVIE